MKVLYLVNFAGKAGIEKYVENLARLLPPAGVECFFAYSIPGELSWKMEEMGVPTLRLRLEWKDARKAAQTLGSYCLRQGIDVIHAQCPRENIIALMALRWAPKVKVVYTEHFTRNMGMAWRLLNRHFTGKNHRCIAVCREGRETMIANGYPPGKIRVIYNGIEPEPEPLRSDLLRRELGLEEGVFLIVCLARFDPEKGLDFLVRSLQKLRETTTRPFCCAIAGDGQLFEEIQSQISAAGLEREIRLLGYRTDTADILASADMYVCSSSRNEALSFAILEAMNAGLPLVVTDVGGNRDLSETDIVCGKCVPYGDEAGFARAIRALMENEDLRSEWSKAATRKVAERFDLRKLALQVYQCYKEKA